MTCVDVAIAASLAAGAKRGTEQLYRCPRHDDEHPSLTINPTKDKWMCGPCGPGAQGGPWTLAAHCAGVDPSNKDVIKQWLADHGLTNGYGRKPTDTHSGGRIITTYSYTDEVGRPLSEVVRYEPKDFRQRKPNGNWNVNGVRRVLYRLPEILRAETIYIVEGEKDADNLRTIGLTATCNAGGAGKWRHEYGDSFKSPQRVIVIPDNDEVGLKHSQQVAASLAGKVASIKILQLPNLTEKGDVSDWLDAGGTRERLEALAAAAPEFRLHDDAVERRMRFTSLGDLLNEPEEAVNWLVADHLPTGGDSLLVAKPKVGKSTLARCLALAVARGEDFLGFKTTQGLVLYLALEEKRSEVKRHFRAMGGRDDDPISVFCASSPADGLAQLREAMKERNPVLVIVDPLFRFVRVKDGNDYAAVTAALEPLHVLARESGAHVLAVHHEGKGSRQGGDAVLGSTALFAAVDTLMTMKRGEKYRTLSSIQRYGTDLEEITLEYDPDTRTLSAGLARSEADQAEAVKAILDFLATQPEPVEESTIHESVEGRKSVKVSALRQAVKDEKITRTGGGKKGDTYRYSVPCSLVPNICREQREQTNKNGLSDSPASTDACSRRFEGSEPNAETREPAFSSEETAEERL